MSKRFFRITESLLLLITLVVVFMSFYFQFVTGLEPCPLCIMQRACAIMVGMFLLMGLCLSTLKRALIAIGFQFFFAIAGIYFAGRQLWLQSLPADNIPACLPGLDLMIKYFPWKDILQALLLGAGDCAKHDWNWLGISMAGWSALYFVGISFASMIIFVLIYRTLKQVTKNG